MRNLDELTAILRRMPGITFDGVNEDMFACSLPLPDGRGDEASVQIIATWRNGWDHVAVAGKGVMPTWKIMQTVKRIFFTNDQWAMQLHPPLHEDVDMYPFCLHLWRPQTFAITTPPPELL